MDVKHDLKNFINGQLGQTASPIFLKRVLTIIDESPDDKDGLLASAEKVHKMVSLFIDKELAKDISDTLKIKIGQSF